MNRKHLLPNAILWAAAILAAALVGAPLVLTLALLPTLAAASLLLAGPGPSVTKCGA